MPSGSYKVIPSIINLALRLDPKEILDIGVGFGKWGVLFREYIEIGDFLFEDSPHYRKRKFNEYIYKNKKNWTKTIDGVEVFSEYLGPLHEFIYNSMHIGDINEVVDTVGSYDLIFCCDVIEHFEKEKGIALIKKLYEKSKKAVILVTPAVFGVQENVFGNEFERHKSLWSRKDFKMYKDASFAFSGHKLVIVLSKEGKKNITNKDNIFLSLVLFVYNYLEYRAIKKRGIQNFSNDFLIRCCLWLRHIKKIIF